jgi:hypothetical protein
MRILVAILAAVTAAAVLAGTSSAAPLPGINIAGCTLGRGGQETVPPGTTVIFRNSWIARTVGLDNLFLSALDLNVSVNGVSVADPMSLWSDPYPVETVFTPPTGQDIDWIYPTGITLESGDSVTIVWSGVLTHPIADGFQPNFGGGHVPAGDLLGGNDTCTVTGA